VLWHPVDYNAIFILTPQLATRTKSHRKEVEKAPRPYASEWLETDRSMTLLLFTPRKSNADGIRV
jgi:hypothetical protein